MIAVVKSVTALALMLVVVVKSVTTLAQMLLVVVVVVFTAKNYFIFLYKLFATKAQHC